MNTVNELKEARGKLVHEAQSILDGAKSASRSLTQEESAKVEAIYADFDKFGQELNTKEKMSQLEQAQQELKVAHRKTAPATIRSVEEKGVVSSAFRSWFLAGTDKFRPTADDIDNASRCGVDLNSKKATLRMLTTDTNNGQGLVQWKEFTSQYEMYLKYYGSVVNVVNNIDTDTGNPLPIPVFDDTNNKGRWLAEGATATVTNPTVSNISLSAFKASSDQIPVSVELLQDSQVTLETVLPMLLGERIGRLLNSAVTVGDGSSKPRGILLDAVASGKLTGGTGAAPVMSIDNLLDLKYSVDKAYRNAPADKRGFMINDKYLAQIRMAKDSQNRYFADPFSSGPGTLDGEQLIINNDMPATGINAKVAAYGDFSRYWLRRVKEVQFMKLEEIRALDGYVVFVAFARYDGALINPNAVKTLAAPAT